MSMANAKPTSRARYPRTTRGLRFTLLTIVVAALCFVSYNVGRLWHDWRHTSPGLNVPESPEFAALLGQPSLAGQWSFADLNWSLRSQGRCRPGSRSTGKSLLPISGSHVKRKIIPNRKYFCFTESKSRLHLNPSRPGKRGVS